MRSHEPVNRLFREVIMLLEAEDDISKRLNVVQGLTTFYSLHLSLPLASLTVS